MLYYNTTSNIMRIYSGSAWENVAVSTSGFATLAGVETLTNKTLTSPKINEDVVVTSTATELNLLDGVSGLVQADFTKLAAIDATADEIDTLDALSRGSIIYGNASAATTVLTKGTANQVLTSDGTDISWSDPASGGLEWQTIITGSTLTAVAGRAYWINTTSNTCTITLPSSASNGDQIIFADYARTWGTNKIIIDSNGLNYQGEDDTNNVEYKTNGQTINIVYSGSTKGWIPLDDDDVADAPSPPPTQKGIFGFGEATGFSRVSTTNLISSSGVVATDTTGVGTARHGIAAASYGSDKAIFGYGSAASGRVSLTNLVSNSGVVASDTTGVGTARNELGATGYGVDKAIFGYGYSGSYVSLTNLVSNSGVVASDVTGVGTSRTAPGATTYGSTGQAIFAYGYLGSSVYTAVSNLVSNVGVVATDTTGVGTASAYVGGTTYGSTGQAIFGYGGASSGDISITNLVSNTGVISSDVTGVGTARSQISSSSYGGDKGIFGFGYLNGTGPLSMTNLISNVGIAASDTTGVGSARASLGAAGYSLSA